MKNEKWEMKNENYAMREVSHAQHSSSELGSVFAQSKL